MVDKKDKELTDKDLQKATGGAAGDRRPVLKGGHSLPGTHPRPTPDPDDQDPTLSPGTPRKRPGGTINPV